MWKQTPIYRTIYAQFIRLFTLSRSQSVKIMIEMVDKPNTTSSGQDRETLGIKALLYLNVAVQSVYSLYVVWCISHC